MLSEGGRSHHRDIKDKKCSLRMRTVTRILPHVIVHVVPSHVVMRIVPSHVVTQTLVVKRTEPESGVQRRARQCRCRRRPGACIGGCCHRTHTHTHTRTAEQVPEAPAAHRRPRLGGRQVPAAAAADPRRPTAPADSADPAAGPHEEASPAASAAPAAAVLLLLGLLEASPAAALLLSLLLGEEQEDVVVGEGEVLEELVVGVQLVGGQVAQLSLQGEGDVRVSINLSDQGPGKNIG